MRFPNVHFKLPSAGGGRVGRIGQQFTMMILGTRYWLGTAAFPAAKSWRPLYRRFLVVYGLAVRSFCASMEKTEGGRHPWLLVGQSALAGLHRL